jgi:hypothetical protein
MEHAHGENEEHHPARKENPAERGSIVASSHQTTSYSMEYPAALNHM